jgi:hypothetical protein
MCFHLEKELPVVLDDLLQLLDAAGDPMAQEDGQ